VYDDRYNRNTSCSDVLITKTKKYKNLYCSFTEFRSDSRHHSSVENDTFLLSLKSGGQTVFPHFFTPPRHLKYQQQHNHSTNTPPIKGRKTKKKGQLLAGGQILRMGQLIQVAQSSCLFCLYASSFFSTVGVAVLQTGHHLFHPEKLKISPCLCKLSYCHSTK